MLNQLQKDAVKMMNAATYLIELKRLYNLAGGRAARSPELDAAYQKNRARFIHQPKRSVGANHAIYR